MKVMILVYLVFFHLISSVFAEIPIAPTTANLTGGSSLDLSWVDNSNNELFFAIDIKKPNKTEYEFLTLTMRNMATCVDKQYIPGIYCYRIKAINDAGESTYSNEACINFTPPKPPVSQINLTSVSGANILMWTPVDGAFGVHIDRKITISGAWGKYDNTLNSPGFWHDHKIATGVVYCYRIVAYGYAGDSVNSNEVCN